MKYWLIDLPELPRLQEAPRTIGEEIIHLSDVLNFMESQHSYTRDDAWNLKLTMSAGFIWEDVLSAALASQMALRPSEIVCDGIYLSPDGIGIDKDITDPETGDLLVQGTGEITVEEYKFTWRSSVRREGEFLVENLPTDNWRYMAQVKSYCYAVGTNIAIMRILYINGDYRTTRPIYRVCRIVFDDTEIKNNWNLIKSNADKLKTQKDKQKEETWQ